MGNKKRYPIPEWMQLDERPLDRGRFGEWGYGYSREVGENEIWRPAVRYFVRSRTWFGNYKEVRFTHGDYYVSDHGRVYSTISNKFLCKCQSHRRKHLRLITEDGSMLRIKRYKLILDNFIEPSERMLNIVRRLLYTVNHLDGNTWNDRLNNIEYTSWRLNMEHYYEMLRPKRKLERKERNLNEELCNS